jgi:hypothetical protein
MVSYMTVVNGQQLTTYNLQLQLKASYAATFTDKFVKFRMEASDYIKLTFKDCDPKLLVLFLMPRDTAQWVTSTESSLALKKCAYWLDMRNHKPITSNGKVTISVPRANALDVAAILGPLKSITENWRNK